VKTARYYRMAVGSTIDHRGELMAYRESDQLIVLRGRVSRPHGEGVDGNTQFVKENICWTVESENMCKPHCKE
jgi:hypothetical protein